MQTNPISTEMSARVHFDDLAREVQQERSARRFRQNAKSDQQDKVVSSHPFIWIRRLAGMVRGASV